MDEDEDEVDEDEDEVDEDEDEVDEDDEKEDEDAAVDSEEGVRELWVSVVLSAADMVVRSSSPASIEVASTWGTDEDAVEGVEADAAES